MVEASAGYPAVLCQRLVRQEVWLSTQRRHPLPGQGLSGHRVWGDAFFRFRMQQVGLAVFS